MSTFLSRLFLSDLMPHGYCYLWKPDIIWLHAISDSLIAISYYFIPILLIYLVRKRQDLPFNWMFVMFGVFIFGCGTTHAMEVWTLWHGTYRLAGVVKAITAAASLVTAVLLVPLIPRALALPHPAELQAANLALENQIAERIAAEEALKRAREELERRVAERTAALAAATEELRKSEERWRAVFENSAAGIALTNAEGRFQATNTAYQSMLGYSESELRGLSFLEVTDSDDQVENWRTFAQLVSGERSSVETEKRYRHKNGRVVWASVYVSTIPDQEGHPKSMLAVSADITERRRASESLYLMQSQMAHMARVTTLGELAASIAHEVNQPLTAVITDANAALRWIGGTRPNLDEGRAAMTRVVNEGKRASEVIQRIRSFLKKGPPKMAPVEINPVVEEVLALIRNECLRQRVAVRTNLGSGMMPVVGDRVQLQQVILNLVMNAIEATAAAPEGPRDLVVASETQEPDRVEVAVSDTGIGIDPADLEKLFNPFFTTKPEGMGMGLSISRSVIEAHGGRLWAVANESRGATFRFTLPVERAVAHA